MNPVETYIWALVYNKFLNVRLPETFSTSN